MIHAEHHEVGPINHAPVADLERRFEIVKGGSGGLLNPLILLAFSDILHLEFWAVLRIFNAFGVRGFLCECEWIRVLGESKVI